MKVKLQIHPFERIITIPDEDLKGMRPKEKERYIEDWMKAEAEFNLDYEWREYE